MASGKSAESVYKLIDDCGGSDDWSSELVLRELIKYLKSDTLIDFVDYFRRNHDLHDEAEVTESADLAAGDSFESIQQEVELPTRASSRFFTSLIPSC